MTRRYITHGGVPSFFCLFVSRPWGYMQLVTPRVVPMAVRMVMSTCRMVFQVSFFMISNVF